MATDNPDAGRRITGDVDVPRIRRIDGSTGHDDGVIEVPLVGHRFTYRVRVALDGPEPRLTELAIAPIDPAGMLTPGDLRAIPSQRLAKAAARFIRLTEAGITTPDALNDTAVEAQPDLPPPGRRKLDDAHYRQVADLLMFAREIGESPREYAAQQLHATTPTLDRWVREAKKRGFLPRDWAASARR